MKKYALIGKDIQDSLSPVIHNGWGCQYDSLDVEKCQLQWALSQPYDGFNVTAPYKEEIIPYLNKLQLAAEEIRAVNVVKKVNGQLHGFNSDVFGFVYSITIDNKLNLDNVGILGDGGAAKAVKWILKGINKKFKQIDSYNYKTNDFQELTGLVNCTPKQDYDLTGLPKSAWIMDLGYKDSTLINEARKQGHFAINGFGMLYRQAEESQRIWNI